MRSMTGFGVGEAKLGGGRVLVEMRSLNHRFLEIRVRMPSELNDHGFFVEQYCREKLQRGRYDVAIRLESSEPGQLAINLDKARQIYHALLALRDELAIGTEVPIASLASFPDLFRTNTGYDVDVARTAIGDALSRSSDALIAMRKTEGDRLRQELEARLSAAENLRRRISDQTASLVDQYRVRLRERLDKLLADRGLTIDKSRLEAELAILADRTDVTEELVRLGSHFEQFETLLASPDAVGRRMDFLLQEMGREANTIGSKCQDASLTSAVVELKAEVERMREQVQNVE